MIYNTDQLLDDFGYLPPSRFDQIVRSYHSAIDSIRLYVTRGIDPGDQLTAMLRNDLRDSFGRADHNRVMVLHQILSFLYNDIPGGCWGSMEKVDAWMALQQPARDDVLAHLSPRTLRALGSVQTRQP